MWCAVQGGNKEAKEASREGTTEKNIFLPLVRLRTVLVLSDFVVVLNSLKSQLVYKNTLLSRPYTPNPIHPPLDPSSPSHMTFCKCTSQYTSRTPLLSKVYEGCTVHLLWYLPEFSRFGYFGHVFFLIPLI